LFSRELQIVSKINLGSIVALSIAMCVTGCDESKQETVGPATPATMPAPSMPGANHPARQADGPVDLSGIARAEGGKTVAELYAERGTLVNSRVKVRGKVVKINSGIMGMDWLHVRDGSGAEGSNDLTVTTKGSAPVKVGDSVVVSGNVVVDKDFGMGPYPVLLQDAEVQVEASGT
jgi:hypothetical protein